MEEEIKDNGLEFMEIKSSLIDIAINKDPKRIIKINPGNAEERRKVVEMTNLILKLIEKNKEDIKNMDEESSEGVYLAENLFDEAAKIIEETFGEGTINKITLDQKDILMLTQFCYNISQYYEKYNKEILKKNSNRETRRASDKKNVKVMK